MLYILMIMEAKNSLRPAVGYYLLDTKPLVKMVFAVLQICQLFCPSYISLAHRGYHKMLCQILVEDKIHCFWIRRPYNVVKRGKTSKLHFGLNFVCFLQLSLILVILMFVSWLFLKKWKNRTHRIFMWIKQRAVICTAPSTVPGTCLFNKCLLLNTQVVLNLCCFCSW